MTWSQTAHSLLANERVLLIIAALLAIGCCMLAVLLIRAIRARRHAPAVPDVPGEDDDFIDVSAMRAVLQDSERILHSTAHDLEGNRQRLERLRMEAAVRRRRAAVPIGNMPQEGDI
jgi:hypothetical protein